MPARTADVSDILGQYMLKGWVLTDRPCPTPGCIVPLLRSRDGSVQFCANCDGTPEKGVTRLAAPSQPAAARPQTPPQSTARPSSAHSSHESPHTLPSRVSTAPTTPQSDSSSLPDLPPPSALTLQRRAQSDLASQRIGQLLLKGWTMLGDECPNEDCYGIPLVRAPGKRTGGECVICGYGSERAAPPSAPTVQMSVPVVPVAAPPSATPAPRATVPQPTTTPTVALFAAAPPPRIVPSMPPPSSPVPTQTSLSGPIAALHSTLDALSGRLLALSANPLMTDPLLIKNTVEAMSAVLDTLAKARAMEAGRV